MPPAHVLTHVAAALAGAAVVWLLLRWRYRQTLRDASAELDTLRRSLQNEHDNVEALRPQAMQALQLETVLTLRGTEHRRIETESAQALEASRRRLAETEAMASSLQQALIDARAELAQALQTRARSGDIAGNPVDDLAPGTHKHAPSRQFDELRSRVAGIISASRKWQRSGPSR